MYIHPCPSVGTNYNLSHRIEEKKHPSSYKCLKVYGQRKRLQAMIIGNSSRL